jgi:hypothetical protein
VYQQTSEAGILRLSDSAWIPEDPLNLDYVAFLDWVEEGNEPLPAPPPPPPTPDYLAFWSILMTSTVYGSIREQAMASLPMNTLATEFIALLGDAKAGHPFPEALQASMLAILQAGTFTEDDITELQAALEASHLDEIYALSSPTA